MRNLEEASALARWLSLVLAGEDPGSPHPPGVPYPPNDEHRVRVETERARLFVNAPGGVVAPPYGSWWMESTLDGETSRRVAKLYREEGLRIDPRTGPADYLPVELEFVHFLLQHQIAASRTGQPELEQAGREREFLERFVNPWLSRFCETGIREAREPFWRRVLAMVESLVASETARLARG